MSYHSFLHADVISRVSRGKHTPLPTPAFWVRQSHPHPHQQHQGPARPKSPNQQCSVDSATCTTSMMCFSSRSVPCVCVLASCRSSLAQPFAYLFISSCLTLTFVCCFIKLRMPPEILGAIMSHLSMAQPSLLALSHPSSCV
jgi:hypothetical protein